MCPLLYIFNGWVFGCGGVGNISCLNNQSFYEQRGLCEPFGNYFWDIHNYMHFGHFNQCLSCVLNTNVVRQCGEEQNNS
jgi:hypothetical protein